MASGPPRPPGSAPGGGGGRLAQWRRSLGRSVAGPVVPLLVATHLSPDQVSLLGLAVALGAAAVLATGHPVVGGSLVLVASVLDLFDGALARARNRASLRGAFLDSSLDRLSEGAILFGLLVHFARRGSTEEVLLLFAAMVGSYLVSYVKARAEGLGIACDIGFFTRAERVLVLALGLLLGQVTIALYVVAVLSFLTAFQRFAHVWRAAQGR